VSFNFSLPFTTRSVQCRSMLPYCHVVCCCEDCVIRRDYCHVRCSQPSTNNKVACGHSTAPGGLKAEIGPLRRQTLSALSRQNQNHKHKAKGYFIWGNHITEALRYDTCLQRTTDFDWLPSSRLSANRMNNTCLCLPSQCYSWSTFTDPGRKAELEWCL